MRRTWDNRMNLLFPMRTLHYQNVYIVYTRTYTTLTPLCTAPLNGIPRERTNNVLFNLLFFSNFQPNYCLIHMVAPSMRSGDHTIYTTANELHQNKENALFIMGVHQKVIKGFQNWRSACYGHP